MTVTARDTRQPQHLAPRSKRQAPWGRLGILLLTMVGVGVMLYPSAGAWFTARAQGSSLSTFATAVEAAPDAAKQDLLDAARAYNAKLPHGQLRDPYSDAPAAGDEGAAAAYRRQLAVPGSAVMARLTIPSIHVDLPVYHGTGSDAIERGAGHMFGSSLPVGGAGTHAVLAAHSGLPNAKMLTDLPKVQEGDTFTITVLGEKLWYRVDQISVVKPDDISKLDIVDGNDHVTLVTCTPVNVNSHRLLVRGTRTDAPENAAQQIGAPTQAGFPWWAVIFVAATGTVATVLFAPRRPRREQPLAVN